MSVLGLDDLILIKKHINRPKDREAINELVELRRQRDKKNRR